MSTDDMCETCNEPRSAHLPTSAGPLTCRREALGEGRYVLAMPSYIRGNGPSFDDEYIPPVYKFEPYATSAAALLPLLYKDPFGFDGDGVEAPEPRELTIHGPLMPARKPARMQSRAPARVPYVERYPPKLDQHLILIHRPTPPEPIDLFDLCDDDADTLVFDPQERLP